MSTIDVISLNARKRLCVDINTCRCSFRLNMESKSEVNFWQYFLVFLVVYLCNLCLHVKISLVEYF